MNDVILMKGFLSPQEQARVVAVTRDVVPGFYVPRTRWGKAMNVRMNCLGHHWSARDYRYHATRVDVDGLPCPPVPDELQHLARRALLDTQYVRQSDVRLYDLCIVNWYPEQTGKLGDHVDNSESPQSLASGYPVVSLSVGDSCEFRIGGVARRDPYDRHVLDSGDLLIFGRSKRLAYHGVRRILPGTAPPHLRLDEPGRLNLTFRLR